mgnify:CR=1 FL=1
MKLFDKIAGKLTMLAVRTAIKEVGKLREVLQVGVDSYRQAHGMPPVYSVQDPAESPEAADLQAKDHGLIGKGDFLSVYVIEELAREFFVPLKHDTDLETLAIQRGWMDERGKFLMLPLSAVGELPQEARQELMADTVQAPRK